MLKFLRVVFKKSNNAEIVNRKNGVYISLFFAIVALVLTILNIIKHTWFMTGATSVLVVGFLVSGLFAHYNKLTACKIIMAVMCGVIFSLFAVTGGNDGFAILWILLVPVISSLLVGLRLGFILSSYFQLFLIALFYTPLRGYVSGYYTDTFMLRFPLLYLATFGGITFLMYQRQKLYDAINHQANFDALTGMYNRHYYNFLRKKKYDTSLTIISIDINGLKAVNDNLGHEAGDELIKGAADLISEAFKDDYCCRVGGDEFTVISTREDVLNSADLLKENTRKWHGKFVEKMSMALGYAKKSEHPKMNIDQLSMLADKYMYADKCEYYKSSGIDRRKN